MHQTLVIDQQTVHVLVLEANHRVANIAGKVSHNEISFRIQMSHLRVRSSTLIMFVVTQLVVELIQQITIIVVQRGNGCIVENGEHSTIRVVHQLANAQIVLEVDHNPFNVLSLVDLLLLVQNGVHKQLMQFFIAKVDQKLFEAVRILTQNFESINVKNADYVRFDQLFLPRWQIAFECNVNLVGDEGEQPLVQSFGQSITPIDCLAVGVHFGEDLVGTSILATAKCLQGCLLVQLQQTTKVVQRIVRFNLHAKGQIQLVRTNRVFEIGQRELNIAQMQNGCTDEEHCFNILQTKSKYLHGSENILKILAIQSGHL